MGENKRFSDIFRIKNIFNALTGYIETKVELYKIQFKEEAAKAISVLSLVLIFSMIVLLFLLFFSHFIGQLLNELYDSFYIGYLIVTGFYLLVGLILFFKRKKIKKSISAMILQEGEIENDTEHEQQNH